jgi:hypothetical protein
MAVDRIAVGLVATILVLCAVSCDEGVGRRACNYRSAVQSGRGHEALAGCEADAARLLDEVAALAEAQGRAGASFAETWLRVGTLLHDMVETSDYGCGRRARSSEWQPAVELARRAMAAGIRLLTDPTVSPKLGTHAALSLGQVLLHPCLSTHAAQQWSPAHPFSSSRRVIGGDGDGAVSAGEESEERIRRANQALAQRNGCGTALKLVHEAASISPWSVNAWYSVQMTMMKCGMWDYSLEAPAPDELMGQVASPEEIEGKRCEAEFAVVTAASHEYYDRVINLAGSMRVWAPSTSLLVYDVGLTNQQASRVASLQNVTYLKLPLGDLPPHVSRTGWDSSTYAFKPLAMWDALSRAPCFLWMDSGLELRRPIDW